MRNALRALSNIQTGVPGNLPAHLGLAYNAWAPIVSSGDDRSKHGKVPDKLRMQNGTDRNPRADWLTKISEMPVSADYKRAFERWKSSFGPPGHILLEFTLDSRLLIGHGNPSATEVGLTVHHTWGTPLIPGPALKGLCANYTVSTYGPDDTTKVPWEHTIDTEKERADFQGVIWDGKHIKAGPGEVYRAIFGAPVTVI